MKHGALDRICGLQIPHNESSHGRLAADQTSDSSPLRVANRGTVDAECCTGRFAARRNAVAGEQSALCYQARNGRGTGCREGIVRFGLPDARIICSPNQNNIIPYLQVKEHLSRPLGR